MIDKIENSATVGEVAGTFGADLLRDAGHSGRWWYFEVFGWKIYCYNFKWRRQALFVHDLHHVVTGYPCTMRGEMQVATWEFAAGRFPSIFSNLFCLPLVALGTMSIPRRTFEAFSRGRRSRSLFGQHIGGDVRDWPFRKLHAMTMKDCCRAAPTLDILGFAALSGAAFAEIAVLLAPVAWMIL